MTQVWGSRGYASRFEIVFETDLMSGHPYKTLPKGTMMVRARNGTSRFDCALDSPDDRAPKGERKQSCPKAP